VKCSIRRQYGAVAEVTEAFTLIALGGVALEDRAEHFDGAIDRGAGREKAVKPGAFVAGAEVERVFVRGLAHESDLAEVGARAAIWAAGDANADGILAEAVFVENGFEFFQNLGQGALALGEGEATGGQGHAREGV